MKMIEERFWSKVNKNGPAPTHRPELGPCWLWTAYTNRDGYGGFQRGRRGAGYVLAHRLSWELHNGPIPAGLHALHACDVRNCVRPSHLFLGTDLDNQRDCIEKGRKVVASGEQSGRHTHPERTARGEANGRSALTELAVRTIRACHEAGFAAPRLAQIFGVSRPHIHNIVRRKFWRHVS